MIIYMHRLFDDAKGDGRLRLLALTFAVVILVSLGLAGVNRAQADTSWQGGIGGWGNGGNWNSGEPDSSDIAYIDNGGTAQITQNGEVCLALSVGHTSGQSGTVQMSTGSLTADFDEHVGTFGTGTFTQTGGTNTVDDVLYLGTNSNSNGTYELSGTGQLSATVEFVGSSGTGTFTQTGGTNTAGNSLILGTSSGSNGTYELSGTSSSQLSANSAYIGYSGTGTFDQTGGTNSVITVTRLGYQSGSKGTYKISAGEFSSASISVGGGGEGILNVIGDDAVIDFGSYTQNTNGELHSTFDIDGLSVIDVSGIATLGGIWVVEDPGANAPMGAFDVLIAAGGITGTFANVILPGPSWNWDISEDETTLWVEHTPEPSSLILLAIGGLALLRRRSR